MNNGDRGLIALILKVIVEQAKLINEEHSFIYDRSGRKRCDVCVFRTLFKFSSENKEFPVKGLSGFYGIRFFYKTLSYVRHTFSGEIAEYLLLHRHITPAKKFQVVFFCDDLEHSLCKGSLEAVLGEKEHTYAVAAGRSDLDPGFFGSNTKEVVRDLEQDADAISDFSGRVFSCSVIQHFNNMEGIADNLIVLMAVDVYNGSDSAGIVLIGYINMSVCSVRMG